MKDKIELYIISLGLLFFLLIFTTINIPICFGNDCVFIGFWKLIKFNIVPLICILIIIIVWILLSGFSHKLRGAVDLPFEVERIESINYEYPTFFTTYIIPLIFFDLNDIRDSIVLIVLLIILGCLFVKTNLYYANPSLALLGYYIYKADVKTRHGNKENVILIAREKIKKGNSVLPKILEENVYYIKINYHE
jgi:hypothetical protein